MIVLWRKSFFDAFFEFQRNEIWVTCISIHQIFWKSCLRGYFCPFSHLYIRFSIAWKLLCSFYWPCKCRHLRLIWRKVIKLWTLRLSRLSEIQQFLVAQLVATCKAFMTCTCKLPKYLLHSFVLSYNSTDSAKLKNSLKVKVFSAWKNENLWIFKVKGSEGSKSLKSFEKLEMLQNLRIRKLEKIGKTRF